MIASDYPITFPFGATDPPYSASHPHRGDDHPCPESTPIVIGGVTVGLTGATGNVIGPHLHIQEWNGDYANVRKPQNSFKGGTVVNIDPNGTQGDGSFGLFVSIQNDDGWVDSYCHLSKINVSIGQVLKEDKDVVIENTSAWKTRMGQVLFEITGETLSDNEFNAWVGAEPFHIVEALIDDKQRAAKNDGSSTAESRLEALKEYVKNL